MDETRAGFLAALAADGDDELTRGIYADWLDENGEPEEAERMRGWAAAKARIVGLLSEPWDEDDYVMSYGDLMRQAEDAIRGDRSLAIRCYSDETLQDKLYDNKEQFWKDVSTVTGIPLPPEVAENSYFSCAC